MQNNSLAAHELRFPEGNGQPDSPRWKLVGLKTMAPRMVVEVRCTTSKPFFQQVGITVVKPHALLLWPI